MQIRTIAALSLPIAAIGIAVARGRKDEAVPEPPAPSVAPPAEPAAGPAAPALFAAGLPVVLAALPAGLASLSAQGCNACHYAAHDTWQHSAHADAWVSPRFQAAWRSAGESTACVS